MFQSLSRSQQQSQQQKDSSQRPKNGGYGSPEFLKQAMYPVVVSTQLNTTLTQMMAEEEEEKPVMKKAVQGKEEEEEPVQGKIAQMQEEEEEVQAKPVQMREEEKLQMKQELGIPGKGDMADMPSSGTRTALPVDVQAKMENSFGTDFSNVNIHQNDTGATNMGALAYTQGNDVHFAPGQYNPGSQKGQELLGHELTHVVQQRQGRVRPTRQAKGLSVNDSPALEHEADILGNKAANNDSVDNTSEFSARFKEDNALKDIYSGSETLELNDSGIKVVKLQQALIDMGYALPNDGVNGIFKMKQKLP